MSLVAAYLTTALAYITGCAQSEIKLHPGDTATFAAPPQGFDIVRPNIPRGKVSSVQYDSKTVGSKRRLLVYTPPGYSTYTRYPVLYLLHGIAGDEREWFINSSPNVVLDNLFNDNKVQPMIVVFPNGRAMRNDSAGGKSFDRLKVYAFTNFEKDLLNDVIPFIEKNYPVMKDRESRALAGVSIGGGQSLKFGLRNLHIFGWIGGFSSAGTWPPSEMVPEETAKRIKLLYISCGNKDDLLFISQCIHLYLEQKKITHIYQVNPGDHSYNVWIKDLYFFVQLLFKSSESKTDISSKRQTDK